MDAEQSEISTYITDLAIKELAKTQSTTNDDFAITESTEPTNREKGVKALLQELLEI